MGNVCVQCGQPQDHGGGPHPMVHLATRGLSSTPGDVQSWHLDCLPYELEQAHRAEHGDLIDKIKGDSKADYAARRLWAQDHAAAKAAESGE